MAHSNTWEEYHDFLSGERQLTTQQRAEFLLQQPILAKRVGAGRLYVPWAGEEGPLPVPLSDTPEEALLLGRRWLEERRLVREEVIRR